MTRPDPARKVAWAVTAIGAFGFVALAALLVPWQPYPGGALDLPDPTAVFPPTLLERALDYSGTARVLSRSALVVSLVVAAVLGFTRVGRWLTGRLRGPWPLRVLEAVAVVLLIGQLAVLPFAIPMQQNRREAGLSRQPWDAWTVDRVLNLGIEIVVTTLALVVLIACARRWRRAWPAVAGGLLAALVVLGSYVYPVLIQPLFNDFHSLPASSLRTGVFELADAEGVQIDDVLVADASKRTTTLNAYVSGFGQTRRVVLYDTLVEGVDEDEALSVVAHELAHAAHDDVLVGTALGAAGAMAGVGLLAVLVGRRRDGLRTAHAVPFVLALFALGSAVAAPIQNTISRQVETRADVDALEATGDRDSFVELQRQLAMHSLSDPEPAAWSQFWFGSHPTVLQRIALADRLLGED